MNAIWSNNALCQVHSSLTYTLSLMLQTCWSYVLRNIHVQIRPFYECYQMTLHLLYFFPAQCLPLSFQSSFLVFLRNSLLNALPISVEIYIDVYVHYLYITIGITLQSLHYGTILCILILFETPCNTLKKLSSCESIGVGGNASTHAIKLFLSS